MILRAKRIYLPAETEDGYRVLVDRLWPRGVLKHDAALDLWCKELSPSTELRQWFHDEPDRFELFASRYRDELEANIVSARALIQRAGQRPLTLLTAARDITRCHVGVLGTFLNDLAQF